ncbi:DNRLRE domain-containing protein, partial [candidate division KSB1 bacterium]
MKIKGLSSVLRFLFMISVLISYLGLFYLDGVINKGRITNAQDLSNKSVLIYEYNNVSNESLGDNRYKLTMGMAVPYSIYQKGDTLINRSSHGEVKWLIKGKQNYKLKRLFSGAAFEEVYDINSDTVSYDFYTDFDISIIEDTVLFKKNGKEVLRKFGFRIFDDAKEEIKVDEINKIGNMVLYSFNRSNKSKSVYVDPTWTWQPDGTAGMDASLLEDVPSTNVGSAASIYIGAMNGGGRRPIIKFSALGDSIPSNANITNAVIILTKTIVYGSPPTTCSTFVLKRDWTEDKTTWTVYDSSGATPLNWEVAGATGNNDIYKTNFDVETSRIDWDAKDTIDVTNCVTQVAGVDSVWHNMGFLLKADVEVNSDRGEWASDDNATPANRPIIEVDYYAEIITLSLSTLSDSSIECTVDTIFTTDLDSFVIALASDSSAIGGVFTGLADTLDTLSINTIYNLIVGGYIDDSLAYYSSPESLYTLACIPDSPFVQSWTTTSLRIHPRRGENPSATNLAIYDSTLQRYINSSGDTVSSAVWQTETEWDTVIVKNRNPNTEYEFGIFAKNGDDCITVISDLNSNKTNSLIDSIEVSAISDSSFRIYFGGDTVYSPFKGYYVIDDSDSSVVSDTIDVFSYGIKSIITNTSFTLNTLKKFRVARVENSFDSLYYSEKDSAYTLTATPTLPVISGTSDSTYLLQFDDISGNPDSIEYAVFDSMYSLYRDTTGDTTGTIVFAVDTVWNNMVMKTYSPNLLISIGIFGKNNDSVFSEVSSDTTWTWAAVPGSTVVSIID